MRGLCAFVDQFLPKGIERAMQRARIVHRNPAFHQYNHVEVAQLPLLVAETFANDALGRIAVHRAFQVFFGDSHTQTCMVQGVGTGEDNEVPVTDTGVFRENEAILGGPKQTALFRQGVIEAFEVLRQDCQQPGGRRCSFRHSAGRDPWHGVP